VTSHHRLSKWPEGNRRLALKEGLPQTRLVRLLEEQGVTFEVTDEIRNGFKRAGAEARVMQAVEKAALEFTRRKTEEEKKRLEEARRQEEEKKQQEEARRKAEEEKKRTAVVQCVTKSISLNSTMSGGLTDSDCEAPQRSGRKAELYTFSGMAGQRVTITMTSTVFDTYLILVGPDGVKVAENDDIESGKDKNSRIVQSLPRSGTYTIQATAYEGSGRGSYSLSLSGCSIRSNLSLGAKISGSLTDSDCEAPNRPGKKAELYTFSGSGSRAAGRIPSGPTRRSSGKSTCKPVLP